MLNIVDPTSQIQQEIAPFTLLGNRGEIHKKSRIMASSHHNHWIYCRTFALANPSDFMAPGHYTDLFFLDEATAISAGHRPCHHCHYQRWNDFHAAWRSRVGHESDDQDSVDLEIRTAQATVQSGTYPRNSAAELLPSGVFIREIPSPELLLIFKYRHPQDKVQTCVYPWTSRGYGVKRSLPTGEVEVVTPAPMLEVIQHGFDPTPLNPILAW